MNELPVRMSVLVNEHVLVEGGLLVLGLLLDGKVVVVPGVEGVPRQESTTALRVRTAIVQISSAPLRT